MNPTIHIPTTAEILRELAPVLGFFAFWLGACIASFLNVVIWRVPRGESIVSPPSHCPKCGAAIKWWQNIPILAWLALRGKCANCRAPISPRYILVETLGGILFLATLWKCLAVEPLAPGPFAVDLLVWWIWISLMIVGSFIDYDLQLLPDFVTVGGMVLGVAGAAAKSLMLGFERGAWTLPTFRPLVWSLVGLVLGFGLLWLIRWLGTKVFRREAMGMGDVFLMGAVGAVFGPVAVVFTLVASSILGSVFGIGMVLMSKAKLGRFVAIPFGPYICAGCLVWMFWGAPLMRWYFALLGVR